MLKYILLIPILLRVLKKDSWNLSKIFSAHIEDLVQFFFLIYWFILINFLYLNLFEFLLQILALDKLFKCTVWSFLFPIFHFQICIYVQKWEWHIIFYFSHLLIRVIMSSYLRNWPFLFLVHIMNYKIHMFLESLR